MPSNAADTDGEAAVPDSVVVCRPKDDMDLKVAQCAFFSSSSLSCHSRPKFLGSTVQVCEYLICLRGRASSPRAGGAVNIASRNVLLHCVKCKHRMYECTHLMLDIENLKVNFVSFTHSTLELGCTWRASHATQRLCACKRLKL